MYNYIPFLMEIKMRVEKRYIDKGVKGGEQDEYRGKVILV